MTLLLALDVVQLVAVIALVVSLPFFARPRRRRS